ncbi:MAG TPA: hypothetical protein VG126_06805 [Thermoleophilaceae bacterium]|nr:hypothetical protein [Thermoleophilaceae bacterium]
MATGHVEPATPWASLGTRQVVELTLPGVAIGLISGAILGVVVAGGGEPFHVALFAAVTLGVPLALAGAGYEILVAQGRIPLGMLTPVALYWAVAFTLCRIFQTALLDLYAGSEVAVPHGWLDFVVYQALVSVGFGIGYWWLHENFAPIWWIRIRERNPVAEHLVRVKLQAVGAVEARRAARRR